MSTASGTDALDAVVRTRESRETAWREYENAVLAAAREGHSQRAIARAAGISQQAVQQFLRNRLEDA